MPAWGGALAEGRRPWGLHGAWGFSSSEMSRGAGVLSALDRDRNAPVLVRSLYLEPRAGPVASGVQNALDGRRYPVHGLRAPDMPTNRAPGNASGGGFSENAV